MWDRYVTLGYLCIDVSNPTSLVLFSIPGIPGAHQLTGVVLISMDGGQNILAATEDKHQTEPNELKYSVRTAAFDSSTIFTAKLMF